MSPTPLLAAVLLLLLPSGLPQPVAAEEAAAGGATRPGAEGAPAVPGNRPDGAGAGTDGAAGETVRVTVEPGARMSAILRRIALAAGVPEATVEGAAAEVEARGFPFPLPSADGVSRLEGLIPPGEYLFAFHPVPANDPAARREAELGRASAVLSTLLAAGARRLERVGGGNGLSAYELVVLASIVEKETVDGGEHARVAGVLYNRLRTGMRLAVCSSVEYALGYHRPFLTFEDLEIDSPYNLYRSGGLPPTPIAAFSDSALRAAASPEPTEDRYFVYDWTLDRLAFARTFEEHLANAAAARENYRRTHGVSGLYRARTDRFYGR